MHASLHTMYQAIMLFGLLFSSFLFLLFLSISPFFLFRQIFLAKTAGLVQLYLQPYLQGYPDLQNLRGMYDLLTGVYQWLFRGKWQNVNQWSEFTHLSHELLQQFTNVTGPYAYYGWFQEFKFIYGEKISRLETYFLPPPL